MAGETVVNEESSSWAYAETKIFPGLFPKLRGNDAIEITKNTQIVNFFVLVTNAKDIIPTLHP